MCLGGALTGCGDDPAPQRRAAFASPAALLPEGMRRLELPLVSCSSNLEDPSGFVLALNDEGDLAVRGAFGNSPVADFIAIPYAEATERYLSAEVQFDSNGVDIGGTYAQLDRGDDAIEVDAYVGAIAVDAYGATDWVSCLVDPASLVELDIVPARVGDPGSRLARAMFTGLTSLDTTYLQRGELSPTHLRWDTWAASATGTPVAESVRFLSFDLATGELRSASTFDALPTGTVWPTQLPTTVPWGGFGAEFEEYEDVAAGSKQFELTVPVGNGGERLSVYVERSGSVVTPYTTYSPNF